jgi:hypothetical protein
MNPSYSEIGGLVLTPDFDQSQSQKDIGLIEEQKRS